MVLNNKNKKSTLYYFDKTEIEGDDLGIFLYWIGFATIGMLFTFTLNVELKSLLEFYIFYDMLGIGYIILHFFYIHKYYDSGKEGDINAEEYTFLNFNRLDSMEFAYGFAVIVVFVIVLIISNQLLNACF